jgi:hypothetical protein
LPSLGNLFRGVMTSKDAADRRIWKIPLFLVHFRFGSTAAVEVARTLVRYGERCRCMLSVTAFNSPMGS